MEKYIHVVMVLHYIIKKHIFKVFLTVLDNYKNGPISHVQFQWPLPLPLPDLIQHVILSNPVWATYRLEKLFRVPIILLFIFHCISISPNPLFLISLGLVI